MSFFCSSLQNSPFQAHFPPGSAYHHTLSELSSLRHCLRFSQVFCWMVPWVCHEPKPRPSYFKLGHQTSNLISRSCQARKQDSQAPCTPWKSGHFPLCSYFQFFQFFLHPVATDWNKLLRKNTLSYHPSYWNMLLAWQLGHAGGRNTCVCVCVDGNVCMSSQIHFIQQRNIQAKKHSHIQIQSPEVIIVIFSSGNQRSKWIENYCLSKISETHIPSYKSTHWWSLLTSFVVVQEKHRFLGSCLPHLCRHSEPQVWVQHGATDTREAESLSICYGLLQNSSSYDLVLDFNIQPEIRKNCFCR